MTFNRRPGAPVVVAWEARLAMFARTPDDRLLHVWFAFEDSGQEILGGPLAGDPSVIAPTPNRLHVFARGVGSVLLHWRWDDRDGQMWGPETLGRIAYDPVAVALPGRAIAVYARGATDALLVWESPAPDAAWHDVRAIEGAAIRSKPAVLYRPGTPVPDVFAAGGVRTEASAAAPSDTGSLMHWGQVHVTGSADPQVGWEDLRGNLAGPPAAVSWSPQRIDVLAPLSPSGIDQWGWAGTERWYDKLGVWHTGRWFGQDPDNVRGDFGGPAVAVSPGPDLAEVYARGPDGFLKAWLWDGTGGAFSPYNHWDGPITVGSVRIGSAPTALKDGNRTRVYAWDESGTTLLLFIRNEAGSWDQGTWEFPWPSDVVVEPTDMVRVQPTVDYLVGRPSDMVVLGVSWSGYQVTGNPLVLERTGGEEARLVVAFPPQHIGEEVSAVPGPPWDPPVPAGAGAPFGHWESVLSGPSQLVFAPATERIELTPEGILSAMQGARLVPHSPDDPPPQTLIELPWQLLIAPAGDGVSEHPSSAVAAESGAVGLWRARLRSTEGSLDTVDTGGEDPFPMPLGLGSRQLVTAQDEPARLGRLELSALGGSLAAHGDWASVTWEHDASLARDHRVRVQVSGVLYPLGHRAEYVELTERFPAEPDAEPIAMLRTSRFLRVTEPVRGRPADPVLRRAFPFDSIEIVTREFSIDEPWTGADRFLRRRRPPEELEETLRRLNDQLVHLRLGSEGGGEPPVMENAAAMDPDSELGQIAGEYLRLIEAIQSTQEQIAAVMELGDQEVPWFFCPRQQGTWVTMTAQCRGGTTSLDLQLPVLFVVDQRIPETDTMLGFDSLRDAEIDRKLAAKWVSIRREVGAVAVPGEDPDSVYAGVVAFPPVPLDLLGAGSPGDIQVVQGLNIAGTLSERAIYPRLGPDPDLPVTDPMAPLWGMKIELPTLRSLLPDQPESHRAPVSFSSAYLDQGPGVDVVLDIVKVDRPGVDGPSPVEENGLLVDFTKNAERSGGLVSPKLTVDAISRVTGPVNTKGLASHKPEDYFEPDATLLGFPLALLLDGLDAVPTITTDLSGPQPIVELAWKKNGHGVPLNPREGSPFRLVDDPPTQATPKPTLTLTVRTCGPDVTTNCEVTNFALSFPTKSPLLTLKFKSLTYKQTAGAAPTLDVQGIQASFSGELDLLQALQEKVSLGDSPPAIAVTSDGIVASYTLPVPDAAAGAFVMRNLAFRAGVVVPFRGGPVAVSVGFASRANPFNLSVLALGGGGYVDLELSRDGLRRLEVSLEFGASVAVDFVVASGEAHVLGGIRFELLPDESVLLTGYLRIGGSLEVLGLVSVSVELVLSLGYQTTGNRLVGRATLVLEIDLTLFSESVELDSGEWEIAGGERDRANASSEPPFAVPSTEEGDPFMTEWLAHRRAFEPVS